MNQDKIIKKIKKLLAMSEDIGSLEEACTAARMARSLIDTCQISELDLAVCFSVGERIKLILEQRQKPTISGG